MATCTDTFRFNEQKIFENVRACLPDEKSQTQNLIECRDDLLFVWNSKNSSLLTLNWRMAKVQGDGKVGYQTLVPSSAQNFIVDKILPSNEGSFIAICGQKGVAVLELPRRWGSNGQFQDGKECIICRTVNLDERVFNNNAHLEVLQVRWHPGSPSDSHLLVLLSDNSIRVYDEFTLRHIWRIGPIPSALPPTGASLPFLNSLGDTAVDFDVAPPRVVDAERDGKGLINESSVNRTSKTDVNKVEWPIIILRGNGNIYILCAGVDTEKPHLQGPVSILPQTQDNYGVDSCSILALPTLPPTLVMAEASGKMHHALLLEAEDVHDTSFNEVDSSLMYWAPEWELHVIETVELELGLVENRARSKGFTCPIFLKRDIINDMRYFAYHNTGLHGVTINFVRQLQDFIECQDDIANQFPLLTATSNAEYLVCTKAIDNDRINAILGFTLLQSPSGLLVLLASGQVLSLDLITDPTLIRGWPVASANKMQLTVDSPLGKIFKDSFEYHIKNILSGNLSQPILKLDKSSEPSPQQSFELLMHATQVWREQYFTKYDKARQEIEKRVKVLMLLKEQQKKEIKQLQNNKDQVRDKAEMLAEMYDEKYEKQVALIKRVQNIVRLATLRLPVISTSEKDFKSQIERINMSTKLLVKKLDQLKLRQESQERQINQLTKNGKERNVVLPPKQEEIIRDALVDMNSQIERMVRDVKQMTNMINMS